MKLAFIGTIASGKSTAIDILSNHGFAVFTLAKVVRIEAQKRGIKNPTRKILQDIGNDLRKRFGSTIIAKKILSDIEGQKRKKKIIVHGIRNDQEALFFKKNGFLLIGITAPQKMRFHRVMKRKKKSDPSTWKGFLAIDERDQKERNNRGQQVKKALKLCDVVVQNNGTIQAFKEKIENIIKREKEDSF